MLFLFAIVDVLSDRIHLPTLARALFGTIVEAELLCADPHIAVL